MDSERPNVCSRTRLPTIWQMLDLGVEDLEGVDLVVMNLTVAGGIPTLSDLDIGHYVRVVDEWTAQFAAWLRGAEHRFQKTPECWKGEIRFFRIGMLAGYMGKYLGLGYIPEQRQVKTMAYTNPSDLFLNGLIDTKRGTCASLPVLHAAMARRLGWPVSLACAHSHFISRYDDGEVVYNIEATEIERGAFGSSPDEWYIRRYGMPKRAVSSGSDLRGLTARETLGVFVSHKARHYSDIGNSAQADSEFALSRYLIPRYRWAYKRAMVHAVWRGGQLFESGEIGHPVALAQELAPVFAPNAFNSMGTERDLGVPSRASPPVRVLRPEGIYMATVPATAIQMG